MKQYIDKSALVTEIERRIKFWQSKPALAPAPYTETECKKILSFLNTLEVKEVDLEKEIRRYRMNNPIIGHREESLYDYITNVAKYFFELGLKANKKI